MTTNPEITYYPQIEQGSDEWHKLRCGLLTASEMKLIITPSTLKSANNDKERSHVYEIAAQRISKYTEPFYIGDDMLRGGVDEIVARQKYHDHYAPVTEYGFITRRINGVMIGYSPDGVVGDDGLIEIKSRRQKYQVETIVKDVIPAEHILQVQTGLLVSARKWLDYISFSAGLHMLVMRIYPDDIIQQAIIEAACIFEERVQKTIRQFNENIARLDVRYLPTERIIELTEEIGL